MTSTHTCKHTHSNTATLVGWSGVGADVWVVSFWLQHDAQLDYYGTRLATCSSDRTIKLFDVTDRNEVQLAELRAYVALPRPFVVPTHSHTHTHTHTHINTTPHRIRLATWLFSCVAIYPR